MISERDRQLNELLEAAIASFDIPDSRYELAVRRYESVGQWLEAFEEDRGQEADVFVQGSFRLGTVTQPIGRHDEYDIDMVGRLHIVKHSISQTELRENVGAGLAAYVLIGPEGRPKLHEGKRCWTLEYPSDRFHIDVLPAILDLEGGGDALLLTDKDLRAWQHFDPIDYADWFYRRMAAASARLRAEAAHAMRAASVEDVPEWRVKTTLQRTVQTLKRHRDIYFQRRPERRPASIIITTLAARSYPGGGESLLASWSTCSHVCRDSFRSEMASGGCQTRYSRLRTLPTVGAKTPNSRNRSLRGSDRRGPISQALATARGVDGTLEAIARCLGDESASSAGASLGSGVAALSGAGQLGLSSSAGTLSPSPSRPAPRHTFYGGDAAPRLP